VPGSPDLGGHFILDTGVPRAGESREISWSLPLYATDRFYERLNDESYIWVPLDAYNSVTGADAEHHTEMDLERYFGLLVPAKVQLLQAA
jgi:hypothetical protein